MATKTIEDEWVKAAVSFEYFLFRHVYIRDVLPDGTTRTIQFQHWPIHDELVADLKRHKRLVDLKARQLGLSWLMAAWIDWGMLFQDGFLAGMTSAGELKAAEFIGKCRFILQHLPYETVPTITRDNVLALEVQGSGVMGFPSTPDAGRGFTFNLFVADEAAFHPYASQAYASYEAATEYGQIIIVSSAGEEDSQVTNDFFQRMFNGAPDNGYMARFYPWDARPGRDAAWAAERRKRLNLPGQFEREYPSTVAEAFRAIYSLRFEVAAIEYGKEHAVRPRPAARFPEGLTGEDVEVYELPQPNQPYLIYTDSAEGVGKDWSVTRIRQARTLKLCLEYRERHLEPEYHGQKARRLAEWYNLAWASWERNKGEGIAMAYSGYGRLLRYDERTPRQKADGAGPQPRPGLPVTEATRDTFISGLAVKLETGELDNNAEGWRECGQFIMVAHEVRGLPVYRAQAAAGAHDDTVACDWGLVWMAEQPGVQSLRSEAGPRVEATAWGYGRKRG